MVRTRRWLLSDSMEIYPARDPGPKHAELSSWKLLQKKSILRNSLRSLPDEEANWTGRGAQKAKAVRPENFMLKWMPFEGSYRRAKVLSDGNAGRGYSMLSDGSNLDYKGRPIRREYESERRSSPFCNELIWPHSKHEIYGKVSSPRIFFFRSHNQISIIRLAQHVSLIGIRMIRHCRINSRY